MNGHTDNRVVKHSNKET